MSGTVISNSLSSTVTIGSTNDLSPVTITSSGTVAPIAAGTLAVLFASGSNLTLINQGVVSGSMGAAGANGGYGVELFSIPAAGDFISNSGTIAGGNGGVYAVGAGNGGIGVYVRYGTLNNGGTILGGAGGTGAGSRAYGGYGVQAYGASITNSKLIAGGDSSFKGQIGLRMLSHSSLTNSGTIIGGSSVNGQNGAGDGVYQNTGTLTNTGQLIGGNNGGASNANRYHGGDGLLIRAATDTNGGSITGGNAYGYGGYGVNFASVNDTLTNNGTITGGNGTGNSTSISYPHNGVGGQGVDLRNGGLLINNGTITGGLGNYRGGYGVLLGSGGTLVNAGTITGGLTGSTQNDAVELAFGGGTVVVDPGAVFNGNVGGSGRGNFVLEFAGHSAGTLGGIGTQFINFNALSFATGATFAVSGAAAGFDSGQVITGFSSTDTLVLEGLTETSYTYTSAGLVLNGGAETIGITGNFSTSNFQVNSGLAGTTITLCFYPGTKLATPGGETAVEDLSAGDEVLTLSGARQVRWVGQSHVSTRFADPLNVLPICIRAGALGRGLPLRDLRLSPCHAIFLDGILAQAGALVNGSTIYRDAAVPEQFIYYHIELESHELLLAAGVAAESFVDNVDRMNFSNWVARGVPGTPIAEMALPRAKSYRQLPLALRARLAARLVA